ELDAGARIPAVEHHPRRRSLNGLSAERRGREVELRIRRGSRVARSHGPRRDTWAAEVTGLDRERACEATREPGGPQQPREIEVAEPRLAHVGHAARRGIH